MRILVAEDNANSRQLISDILTTMGHEVIIAIDGPRALSAAQSEHPDLIILDVNMPRMSGFEVCRKIKSSEDTAEIPILMLTALTDVEKRVTGLGLGADDYLTKPFNARELMARVETRLREKAKADGLRATKEMIRLTFERFVPHSVVEQLLQDPTQVKLGGKLQELTVMFADLENFTTVSEQTEPETLLAILNGYHALLVRIILQYAGTVDKFMGDSVLALYNAPLEQKDHAVRAVKTALRIRAALAEFHQSFEPLYQMPINFGIHTGPAIVGNVGAPEIMDYTAVGDTVNLANRLQELGRSGQILISHATYEQVADEVVVRELGNHSIRGRSNPVLVYEVLELAD